MKKTNINKVVGSAKSIGIFLLSSLLLSKLFIHNVHAGTVEVKGVKVSCDTNCTFHVTLKHADTGWQHYANAWEVLDSDQTLIAKRVLYHPHVDEQPFTRSLSNIEIPEGTTTVWIRGNDSVHGFSELYEVKLDEN